MNAALAQVDLADRAEESVAELSGGQQQRVLIARALAGRHDLLVLDEPTAGVDLPTQELLARLLGEAVAAGTAVLLVAHELGPSERLVDRAVVLRDGRVAYAGPPGPAAEAGDHSHAHASHLPRDRVLPEEGIWR